MCVRGNTAIDRNSPVIAAVCVAVMLAINARRTTQLRDVVLEAGDGSFEHGGCTRIAMRTKDEHTTDA